MLSRSLFLSRRLCQGHQRQRLVMLRPMSSQDLNKKIPTLMELPEVPFPAIRHTMRNFFFVHFLLRPYFDPDFTKENFLDGAKAAVEFVSNCLATGDLEALEESKAVTTECLKEIKLNISLFSLAQRQRLTVSKADIYYNFVYQIGIMFEDEDGDEESSNPIKRHVEITYTAHSLPNFETRADQAESVQAMRENINEDGGPIILNYRFIREYTKGVEDSWTINALNHYHLKERL